MVQSELMQVDPGRTVEQTVHPAPQALLSVVVSTHKPPHSVNPAPQVTLHVVPAHVSVALVMVLHVAQSPAQQIPPVPHAVPLGTSTIEPQLCCPVLQDVVPV
jgi:hypothetical protein